MSDKISTYELMILEEETKISGAEHQKRVISLRIAKRQAETRRDEDHALLQDDAISTANAEINKIKKLIEEEKAHGTT